MERTFHFILNPVSRSGKGRKLWDTVIEPYLQAAQIQYEAHFSREAGILSVWPGRSLPLPEPGSAIW